MPQKAYVIGVPQDNTVTTGLQDFKNLMIKFSRLVPLQDRCGKLTSQCAKNGCNFATECHKINKPTDKFGVVSRTS